MGPAHLHTRRGLASLDLRDLPEQERPEAGDPQGGDAGRSAGSNGGQRSLYAGHPFPGARRDRSGRRGADPSRGFRPPDRDVAERPELSRRGEHRKRPVRSPGTLRPAPCGSSVLTDFRLVLRTRSRSHPARDRAPLRSCSRRGAGLALAREVVGYCDGDPACRVAAALGGSPAVDGTGPGQVLASGVVAAPAVCRWIVVTPRCLRARRRVDEDYDRVTDGLRVNEPQRLLVGRFAEAAPSGIQLLAQPRDSSTTSPSTVELHTASFRV